MKHVFYPSQHISIIFMVGNTMGIFPTYFQHISFGNMRLHIQCPGLDSAWVNGVWLVHWSSSGLASGCFMESGGLVSSCSNGFLPVMCPVLRSSPVAHFCPPDTRLGGTGHQLDMYRTWTGHEPELCRSPVLTNGGESLVEVQWNSDGHTGIPLEVQSSPPEFQPETWGKVKYSKNKQNENDENDKIKQNDKSNKYKQIYIYI